MVSEAGLTSPMLQQLGIGQTAERHVGDGGRDLGGKGRNLVAMGFTRVMNLRGGMIAWNQAALPVAK